MKHFFTGMLFGAAFCLSIAGGVYIAWSHPMPLRPEDMVASPAVTCVDLGMGHWGECRKIMGGK
jgi:hypothetical protein